MAIYGYLMATRAVDPVAVERARMAQVSAGRTPEPPQPLRAWCGACCRNWQPASLITTLDVSSEILRVAA